MEMYQATITVGYTHLKFKFLFFESACKFIETVLESCEESVEVSIKRIVVDKEEVKNEPV